MPRRFLFPTLALFAASSLGSSTARADDRQACDAAYDQAQTLRDAKKLIDAREQLRVCARPSCPGTMARDCIAWLGDAEARIPSVIVVANDSTGTPRADVTVTVDDAASSRAVDGTSWEVEPGTHTFHFVGTNGAKLDKSVVVIEGQKLQRIAVTLGAAPVLVKPKEPAAGGSSSYRTVGYVVGGVGVAGLVVGGIFGALALSTKGSDCPTETTCKPGTASKALTQGNVATAALVAGGVLAAGGLTIVLLAPKKGDSGATTAQLSPLIGSAGSGLMLGGSF